MSLTRLIKNVAKRKQQLTTGDPNNRVTLYQDALAKLGLFIFDTIRPGGLIEHHFNLRDDQGRTIELELKRRVRRRHYPWPSQSTRCACLHGSV